MDGTTFLKMWNHVLFEDYKSSVDPIQVGLTLFFRYKTGAYFRLKPKFWPKMSMYEKCDLNRSVAYFRSAAYSGKTG